MSFSITVIYLINKLKTTIILISGKRVKAPSKCCVCWSVNIFSRRQQCHYDHCRSPKSLFILLIYILVDTRGMESGTYQLQYLLGCGIHHHSNPLGTGRCFSVASVINCQVVLWCVNYIPTFHIKLIQDRYNVSWQQALYEHWSNVNVTSL